MDSIFCATCLKNQHIYTEALRQFELPDDQSDPEYNDRIRAFRKWRADLEQRYPQVCATCEPKVQQQLNKASYTAKTDHLRRVMDRTKARQREVKKRGALDVLDSAGKLAWNIAFALEFCWHASVLCSLFVEDDTIATTTHWLVAPMRITCHYVLMLSPSADRYIRWSISLGLASFVWNPRFKQTIRGFTSHILGVGQWYTYQFVILFVRLACLFVSQYNDSKGISAEAQLGAHLVIGILMSYVSTTLMYRVRITGLTGSRCIHCLEKPFVTTLRPYSGQISRSILFQQMSRNLHHRAGVMTWGVSWTRFWKPLPNPTRPAKNTLSWVHLFVIRRV